MNQHRAMAEVWEASEMYLVSRHAWSTVTLSWGRQERTAFGTGDRLPLVCLFWFGLAQQPAQLLQARFPSHMRRNTLVWWGLFPYSFSSFLYWCLFFLTKPPACGMASLLTMRELVRTFWCFSSSLWVQAGSLIYCVEYMKKCTLK